MEYSFHTMHSLFIQLGLDHSDEAIDAFIEKHSPLDNTVQLHDAPFWSYSQSLFLKYAKDEDADWAEIVDELDVMLRYDDDEEKQ